MLIGVDVDPGESVERISSWAEGNGFFWQLAPVSAQPLKDYRISQQSAAVGIDASGRNRPPQERRAAGRRQVARLAEHPRWTDGDGAARGSVDGRLRTGRACPGRGCAHGRSGPRDIDRRACNPARPARADCGCRSHRCPSAIRGSGADYHSVTVSHGDASPSAHRYSPANDNANTQATAALGLRGRQSRAGLYRDCGERGDVHTL